MQLAMCVMLQMFLRYTERFKDRLQFVNVRFVFIQACGCLRQYTIVPITMTTAMTQATTTPTIRPTFGAERAIIIPPY